MKTLTLFETFIELSEKLYAAKVSRDTATLLPNIVRHRVEVLAAQRKLNRCKALLTKRLQEQEEESIKLRHEIGYTKRWGMRMYGLGLKANHLIRQIWYSRRKYQRLLKEKTNE